MDAGSMLTKAMTEGLVALECGVYYATKVGAWGEPHVDHGAILGLVGEEDAVEAYLVKQVGDT